MTRFSVAILAFGELGLSAKTSLQSLRNIGPEEVFAICDESGEQWMRKNADPELMQILHVYRPQENDLIELNIHSNASTGYSEFGQERFIKLTTFKWDVIGHALETSNSDWVIFSDLDVIWLRRPQIDYSLLPKGVKVLAQDDTPGLQIPPHFCTGIIFWKTKCGAEDHSRELLKLQKTGILSGSLIPDEPIFNRYFSQSQAKQIQVQTLPRDQYIIGHRFFRTLLKANISGVVAFHANYVVGETAKLRRLTAILSKNQGSATWIFIGLLEFGKKLKVKLKR